MTNPRTEHDHLRRRASALMALALSVGCEAAPEDTAFDPDDALELELADSEVQSAPLPTIDDDLASAMPDDTVSANIGANAHHRVEIGTCPPGDPNCAAAIPMTGRSSPLFATVDEAVQQYMKIHCTGAGVLAISRKGRRVYKRGFGRTKGIAASFAGYCPEAEYDATGKYMLPDTPLPIASVSKFVTAAMARELIQARNAQRLCGYVDITSKKLTDPCLGLLPDELLERMKPDGLHAPPVTSTPVCATRTACSDPICPDQGWADITVGDLIGHSSGLARDGDSMSFLMSNVGDIRGYGVNDWSDAHANVVAKTKYPNELTAARADIAGELGTFPSNIMFLDYYDDGNGANELDDSLIAATGNCFAYPPGGSHDGAYNPNNTTFPPDGSYSNLGYQVLGRVVAHLHTELGLGAPYYSEPTGFPELHDDSALGTFLADNGIGAGIWSDHAIFRRQVGYAPGYEDPIPQRRTWSTGSSTYVPMVSFWGRPFCWFTGIPGNECDTSDWLGSSMHRATWDFQTDGLPGYADWAPWVPFYRKFFGVWEGSGNLAAEMPAMLPLLERYTVYSGGAGPQWMGREFATCGADCQRTGGKNGMYSGTVAWGFQLEGEASYSGKIPLSGGQYVTEQDYALWPTATWANADDVRFATAFNIDHREPYWYGPDRVTGMYTLVNEWKDSMYSIGKWLAYSMGTPSGGTPNVDWDAVDRMIEHQSRHIVGMATAWGLTFYFYEDDSFGAAAGSPSAHLGPDAPGGVIAYALPATRIGTDVVGTAIFGNDTYTWYDDGHYSKTTGWPTDLGSVTASADYVLPPGQFYDDIVGIGMSSSGSVWSWYRDGTRARGTLSDLGSVFVGGYSVPPGQTFDDIEAMSMDWENGNYTWARYKDGSVSKGYTYDMDGISYYRGPVVGMSMFQDQTRVWYANGYWRRFNGTPQENMNIPVVLEEGYWDPSAGHSLDDVVGIAESSDGQGWIYYDNGDYAQITEGLVSESVTGTVLLPNGYSASQLVAVGIDDTGVVYSWYTTGQYATGTPGNLGSGGPTAPYVLPLGVDASAVSGIAYDTTAPDPYAWVLYDFGAVSRGHEDDLAEDIWSAP